MKIVSAIVLLLVCAGTAAAQTNDLDPRITALVGAYRKNGSARF